MRRKNSRLLITYSPLRRKFAGGGNTMGIVSSALGGVSSILDSAMQNAQIADTSAIESTMDNAGKNVEASSLDSLMEQWGATSNFGNQTNWRDVRGMSRGEMAGNILGAGLSGASAGAAAGPWGSIIGGAVGLLGSGIGAAIGNQKARNKAAELNKMANEANLRQQLAFSSNAQSIMDQQNLANMSILFSKGGKIYIKPSKRGTFTAAAKKRGMGVQEFASKVLANKGNYSPAMVKKANFARNFGGRKNAEGGFLEDFDFMENPRGDNRTNYVEIKSEPDFSSIKTTRNRAYNKDYISYIYNKLKDSYLGDTQIAAILGSIIEESGGNPFAKSNTGKFQGLLQWEKGRYSPISDDVYEELDNQIQYILRSITNTSDKKSWTHGGAGSGYSSYKEPYDEFFNDKSSISDATRAFNLGYVRPHGKHESADNRSSVAEQVYNIIHHDKSLNKQAVSALSKAEASNAEFVKRLNNRNRDYIQDWENPNNIATHKLGWGEDDKGAFVYPGVSNISGELVDYTRIPYSPNTAIDVAFDNDDIIRMSPEEASWFTENYKNYYPKGNGKNSFKKGETLSVHGADFSNGVIQVNNGGLHEQNPMEGVPMGIAPDGLPNLVEEGEVIFNDYVFSNRLKPKKETLRASGLKGYKNKTFAQIAKDLQKESEERPNDPISKRGLEDSMTKLATVQEDMRQRRNDNKYLDGGPLPKIIFGPDGYIRRLFTAPEYAISYDLNEYFDTRNTDNRMRDILMTPLPKDSSSDATDDTDTIGGTWLRYAPAIGSAIGSLVSAFSKPDYEHSNTILNELNRQRPRGVRFKPVSNYIRYNPLNTSYLMNRLGAETAASRRALENTGGGNAGAVRNSLIGLNRSAQDALGDAYLKAEQYNDNLMRQVEEFNRRTNMFNSQGAMQADTYNSGLQNTYNARRLSTIGTIAGMREAADAALEQNRSMNFTGLFDNIGEIGRENFIFNQIRNNPAYRYYTDNSGNTIYKGKYGGMLTKRNRKRRRG